MRTRIIRIATAVAAVLSLAALAGPALQSDETAQVGHVVADSAWGAVTPRLTRS